MPTFFDGVRVMWSGSGGPPRAPIFEKDQPPVRKNQATHHAAVNPVMCGGGETYAAVYAARERLANKTFLSRKPVGTN